MEIEALKKGIADCIKAIESGKKAIDGRYYQSFDSKFLSYLKGLIEEHPEECPTAALGVRSNKQRIILYPPTIDWSWMFQRPQQILSQFAKHGWKVIYVNKTQKKGMPPVTVLPNVEVHHDWDLVKRTFIEVDVLWVTWAYHHDVPIKAKVTVYDCLDDFPDWDKYEHSMIKRSNIVFTTSQALFDKHSKCGKKVVMVRNACDPVYIGSRIYPLPIEFASVKRPIVGFIGALGSWVDAELLDKISRKFSLVIIGPKFGKEPPAHAKYLGVRNYTQLPNYYANIDIGIIPFTINRTSIAADPIKMYEYMAAGKPVVTTNIPECKAYPSVVLTSSNHDEFIANIEKALRIPNVSSVARQIALENTWESRFYTIQREIEELL